MKGHILLADTLGNFHEVNNAGAVHTTAELLVQRARELGVVLTVEQRPLTPLAMGNHESVVLVREARERA